MGRWVWVAELSRGRRHTAADLVHKAVPICGQLSATADNQTRGCAVFDSTRCYTLLGSLRVAHSLVYHGT